MTQTQQLIAYIGIALIGLTIWQHWRKDIADVLFNTTNASDGPSSGSPFAPGTGPAPYTKYPYYIVPGPSGGTTIAPQIP